MFPSLNGLVATTLLVVFVNLLPADAKPNKIRMNVYFEPQDPESTRFFKSELLPLFQDTSIAERVDLKLVPFGHAQCDASHQEYACTCTQGTDECEIMHLMACTLHDYRHHEDAVELVSCLQGQPNFDTAFEQCIRKLPDKEANWLARCPREFRGKYLSWINGLKTKAIGFELPNMPTVAVNGEVNLDTPVGLRDQVCSLLHSPKPSGC
ncbi:hypothetical protein M3Y97_00009700 [Aphelenchoides bicaudatus]|nr:hypothetical protein M3Y97_00009700 [Aphelenchoides bicaudatus]